MPLLSRRAALAAPAAGVLAARSSAHEEDELLIDECNRVIEAMRDCNACYGYPDHYTLEQGKPYEEQAGRLVDLADEHGTRALRFSATTLAGILAKARAGRALVAQSVDGRPQTNGIGDELAWSALDDLLRLT